MNATRDVTVEPITATVSVETHIRGKAKSSERQPSGRPAIERQFGDSFWRDGQQWVYRDRTFDRKGDWYVEHVHDGQGNVIHHAEEPLSEHLGHGSDR